MIEDMTIRKLAPHRENVRLPQVGGPQAVLLYLSRYTHRVAIANSRLIACCSRSRQADLSMLRRSHDHHRGLRARSVSTAPADSSTHPNRGRHLMTASHPRKSDRRTRCLSTGHGRARLDIRLSSQIVRPLTEFDATRRSSSSRFTVHRLVVERLNSIHPPHPRHSNPHSPRRVTHVPLPRFPPLEVCVRRPRCAPRHRRRQASANLHLSRNNGRRPVLSVSSGLHRLPQDARLR